MLQLINVFLGPGRLFSLENVKNAHGFFSLARKTSKVCIRVAAVLGKSRKRVHDAPNSVRNRTSPHTQGCRSHFRDRHPYLPRMWDDAYLSLPSSSTRPT